MGMFDEIVCDIELPRIGKTDMVFQTKDTPEQYIDQYKIDGEGRLWHEAYDIVDKSEAAKWRAEHPDEPEPDWGWEAYLGSMSRNNKRMEPCDMTGEVRFYTHIGKGSDGEWFEFSAYFIDGEMQSLTEIKEAE